MKDLSNKNVIHIKKNGVEYLQFKRLLEYKNEIKHAYSLGIDKNFRTINIDNTELTEKQKNIMEKSYQSLCEAIEIDYQKLIRPNQEHTDCIKTVTKKIEEKTPDFNIKAYQKTDGLITKQKDLTLVTTNADCILILFYDPKKKVIANVHSGWKGTIQRISEKTIIKMKKEFNCNPADIICCITPSIRKCHFEVEKEVKDMFEKEFNEILKTNTEIIEEKIKDKKWNIDTVKINQIILQQQGVKPENIIDSGICSVCNSDIIHSYRVEKQGYGLNTALIEMTN